MELWRASQQRQHILCTLVLIQKKAVKVSKSGLRYFIERGGAILLKFLSETNNQGTAPTPETFPEFVSCGYLDVKIGGVTSLLPALAMKPVCQDFYSTPAISNADTIKDVLKGELWLQSGVFAYV